jgi:hypothetical protein
MGINVPAAGPVTFEIDEADSAWPAVAAWVQRQRPVDLVRTEFTRAEIDAAEWLQLQPTWHYGYPQPREDSFGYRSATYDPNTRCAACGAGLTQCAPFQMKGEPRWGRNGLLQLNWVFDEYFATPDVWRTVFAPAGVAARPVVNRAGTELSTVVQLVIGDPVPVAVDGRPSRRCPTCDRDIYLPVVRGPFPALAGRTDQALVWSREWFGGGAQAHRQVLIRADLASALTAAKVRGATLRPLA